jgi:Yippee zinc-binding/DNA-binding /Mis18, centromere assembly
MKEDIQDTETDIKNPLVFSCKKCKTILGDSYSMVISNADVNVVALSSASNITRSAEVFTSKFGADVGSTYYSFMCTSCHFTVGRYYLTTSSDLDNLRGRFSFMVDEISSYELGKAQIGKMPEIVVHSEVAHIQEKPIVEVYELLSTEVTKVSL